MSISKVRDYSLPMMRELGSSGVRWGGGEREEDLHSYRSIEQHYGLTVRFRSRSGSLDFSGGPRRLLDWPLGFHSAGPAAGRGHWGASQVSSESREPVMAAEAAGHFPSFFRGAREVSFLPEKDTSGVRQNLSEKFLRSEDPLASLRDQNPLQSSSLSPAAQIFEIQLEGVGIYRGELKEGEMHGKGQLEGPDGFLLYRGDFANCLFEGKGEVFFRDPQPLPDSPAPWEDISLLAPFRTSYEGRFQGNVAQGTGLLKFGKKSQFFGEFYADLPDGFGVWTQGEERVVGIWRRGLFTTRF